MSYIIGFIESTGGVARLILKVLASMRFVFRERRQILRYMYEISGETIFILVFASIFIGMVSAYQIAYQMKDIMPLMYVSTIIVQAVLIEIGPLLTGIGFSGKIASQTAAEISSMKITDQIDALEVMSIDPVEYLIMPRVVAAILIIPFITIITEIAIVFGTFLISVFGLDITTNMFVEGSKKGFYMFQIFGGLIKSIAFGFFTVVIACYYGISAKAGARSVGKATTLSVTTSAVVVVVMDYIFTRFLFIW